MSKSTQLDGDMILSKIPGIQDDFEQIRDMAPSGFVLALNLSWVGPEFLHSEFPDKWREIYESKGYFMFDPIYYWAVTHSGRVRWSEVGLPDPQGIRKKAAKYGLVYGATVAQKAGNKKSFLSVSRADAEFTEPEFAKLEGFLMKWLDVVTERPLLKPGEFEALKCLRDGLDQAEIAKTLGVSLSTVKKRFRSIRKKFGAATIAEALSIAVEKRYFEG